MLLGIAPGADRATIRRAYAAKLKLTSPEDDPDGFMALRAAYDRAMQLAGNAAPAAQPSRPNPPPLPLPPLTPPAQAAPRPAPAAPPPAAGQAQPVPRSTVTPAAPGPQAPPIPPVIPGIAPPPAAEPNPTDPAANRADERRAFESTRQAMADALDGRGATSDDALRRLFMVLLASPMLGELSFRDGFEEWLAWRLSDTLPRGDALLVPAITAFGWSNDASFRQPSIQVRRVLQRQAEIAYMIESARPGSPRAAGWAALTRPPPVGLRSVIIPNATFKQIDQLVDAAAGPMPGIAPAFDQSALVWWQQKREDRPLALRPAFLITAVGVMFAMRASGYAPDSRSPGMIALYLVFGGIYVAAKSVTIRFGAQGKTASVWGFFSRPDWRTHGWVALLLAIPMLAPLGGLVVISSITAAVAWMVLVSPLLGRTRVTKPVPPRNPRSFGRFGQGVIKFWLVAIVVAGVLQAIVTRLQ